MKKKDPVMWSLDQDKSPLNLFLVPENAFPISFTPPMSMYFKSAVLPNAASSVSMAAKNSAFVVGLCLNSKKIITGILLVLGLLLVLVLVGCPTEAPKKPKAEDEEKGPCDVDYRHTPTTNAELKTAIETEIADGKDNADSLCSHFHHY
jgi:hypothetical protein